MGSLLACVLWRQLDLDGFWRPRLPPSREGTPWLLVLQALVAYRLIDPGSERRLCTVTGSMPARWRTFSTPTSHWPRRTRCTDVWTSSWSTKTISSNSWCGVGAKLFGAKFDVLLYDLTSTYFETDVERPATDLRQYGYSRDCDRPAPVRLQP